MQGPIRALRRRRLLPARHHHQAHITLLALQQHRRHGLAGEGVTDSAEHFVCLAPEVARELQDIAKHPVPGDEQHRGNLRLHRGERLRVNDRWRLDVEANGTGQPGGGSPGAQRIGRHEHRQQNQPE